MLRSPSSPRAARRPTPAPYRDQLDAGDKVAPPRSPSPRSSPRCSSPRPGAAAARPGRAAIADLEVLPRPLAVPRPARRWRFTSATRPGPPPRSLSLRFLPRYSSPRPPPCPARRRRLPSPFGRAAAARPPQ
jgi:hypothetical protein